MENKGHSAIPAHIFYGLNRLEAGRWSPDRRTWSLKLGEGFFTTVSLSRGIKFSHSMEVDTHATLLGACATEAPGTALLLAADEAERRYDPDKDGIDRDDAVFDQGTVARFEGGDIAIEVSNHFVFLTQGTFRMTIPTRTARQRAGLISAFQRISEVHGEDFAREPERSLDSEALPDPLPTSRPGGQ